MKTKNKLGIWMDHSIAHLMEFTSNHFEIETIESKFSKNEKMETLHKSESLSDYYRKISETIKDYKRVILFGPTNAKTELFDLLSEDYRFLKIKFEIKDTDKMTANQQHEFVREYFSKA